MFLHKKKTAHKEWNGMECEIAALFIECYIVRRVDSHTNIRCTYTK